MRRTLVVLTALVLVMASVGMASAQPPPGGGPPGGGRGGFGRGGGGGLGMLQIKEVQTELNMTPHQISVLDTKQQEVRGAMQDLFQAGGGPQNMSPEDRQKMMTKVQEIQSKAVSDILDTKQMVRYHQLELQQQGIGAVGRNKELATKLDLTADQTKQIADIQRQARQEMQAAMQTAGGFQALQNMSADDRKKFQAKMADSQKATEAKMLAVLTDKQQAKWKEMTGPHFDFPAMGGFGGRRPGGPPPGQ